MCIYKFRYTGVYFLSLRVPRGLTVLKASITYAIGSQTGGMAARVADARQSSRVVAQLLDARAVDLHYKARCGAALLVAYSVCLPAGLLACPCACFLCITFTQGVTFRQRCESAVAAHSESCRGKWNWVHVWGNDAMNSS